MSTRSRSVRDAAATRKRILAAATAEFARYGYAGARVDRISRKARTFDRMIYYYYGDKVGLFRVVLENVYEDLWRAEEALRLAGVAPEAGMRELVGFTWRYFVEHPEFIRLLNSENLQRGRNVRRSKRVGRLSSPFIDTLRDLLRRGAAKGVFRRRVDPMRLYLTIAALAYFYVSNRYTLSNFLAVDLMAPRNREAWLAHITEVVLASIRTKARRRR
jgi:AcrR family transcriptional regulator